MTDNNQRKFVIRMVILFGVVGLLLGGFFAIQEEMYDIGALIFVGLTAFGFLIALFGIALSRFMGHIARTKSEKTYKIVYYIIIVGSVLGIILFKLLQVLDHLD